MAMHQKWGNSSYLWFLEKTAIYVVFDGVFKKIATLKFFTDLCIKSLKRDNQNMSKLKKYFLIFLRFSKFKLVTIATMQNLVQNVFND